MINQIFDKDSFKIMSLFSLSPGSKFRRIEIKERTKLNNVPLDNALQRLLSSQILKRDKNLYAINFQNDLSKQVLEIPAKQYKNLKELPFNVYLLLLDLVKEISTTKGIELYLFGSYSKLVYNEKSDVDIAILTPEKFDKNNIQNITQKLEEIYAKNVEIHFFTKKLFYKNKKDPLIKEIIQNGIKLVWEEFNTHLTLLLSKIYDASAQKFR